MPATAYPHIEIDAKGVACIDGMRTRVIDIAMDRIAYKWDADEIQRQHPHLSLAQIYSALAYYYDHQEQLDREIADRQRTADEFFAKTGEGPAMAKFRAHRDQSP